MTKENNDKPQSLEQAEIIIASLESELAEVKQQRDQKTQEWQQMANELVKTKAKKNNKNDISLTKKEIMTTAQGLGMKTQEEYQSLQAEIAKLKSSGFSKLWWLLIIPLIWLIWITVKKYLFF